jgi:endoglucanase
MKETIEKLNKIIAPSGFEDNLGKELIEILKPMVADTDFMGNITVSHRGKAPKILVLAHIDDDSIVVNHIEKDGFLRFYPASNIKEQQLIGREVVFPNGTVGLVGAEEVTEGTVLSFDKMFIDIGAEDKKTAQKMVSIGDHAAIKHTPSVVGDRIIGTNSCKIPSSILAHVAKEFDGATDVTFAFCVQGRLGARGASAVITRENPDLLITIETIFATDTPNCPNKAKLNLDEGPVLVVGAVTPTDKHVNAIIEETAESAGIKIQKAVKTHYDIGDARMNSMLSAVPMATIAVPCRNYQFSSVISSNDAVLAAKLLSKILRKKLIK